MFQSTRLKLTAWYLFIIMFITILFSVVIYQLLTNEIIRFDRIQRFRIEQDFRRSFIPHPYTPLVEETKHRLLLRLLFIDTSIFILAGGLGYFLAGITLKPIKNMVDEQKRFISDASHELRTPLTSLKTAFEVFLRGKHSTVHDAKILVQESIIEVNALETLSNSLLQLSQQEKISHADNTEIISIPHAINDALHRVNPMIKEKHMTVSVMAEPTKVQGNLQSLVDVFVTILDNAVKYSPEQSTITITTSSSDHDVKILFVDQGIGIAKKDLPYIFDRFYRADAARSTTQAKGYGLGLSIAKKIIHAHNGTIEVESVIKKGSTFIVHLPKA